MIQLSVIAIAFLLLAPVPQTPVGASIEGRILRADNNEPVARARVTLAPAADPGSADYLQIPQTESSVSNEEGTFAFDRLLPKKYSIIVEADGYVRQSYGPLEVVSSKDAAGRNSSV